MKKLASIFLFILLSLPSAIGSTKVHDLSSAFDALCLTQPAPPKQRMYSEKEKFTHYQNLLREDPIISSLDVRQKSYESSGVMELAIGREYFIHSFSYEDGLNKAMDWFQRAFSLGERNAALSIAHVYTEKKENARAIEWLKKAFFLKTLERGDYCVELGLIFLLNEDKEGAIRLFYESQTFLGYRLASHHAERLEEKIAFLSKAIDKIKDLNDPLITLYCDELEDLKRKASKKEPDNKAVR
jgi:tetratricopeptide (TPR) repeat protein